MPTEEELRAVVQAKLPTIVERMNAALRGENLAPLGVVLNRIGRGGKLPNWYEMLKQTKALPAMDPKSIGSVVEMIFVAVLESETFAAEKMTLRVNPARGVDLPDLKLGVKSPSMNRYTSEPFFSAYERLLGSTYDAVILLTDYQKGKSKPPLKLQIIQHRYLRNTQLADKGLCQIAKSQRDWMLAQGEADAKRVFRFLAYVNQRDWRAGTLLQLVTKIRDEAQLKNIIAAAETDFKRRNEMNAKSNAAIMAEEELQAVKNISKISPLSVGVIAAVDNWVIETQKEFGLMPGGSEWGRLQASPFDGELTISFALQWRYGFSRIFPKPKTPKAKKTAPVRKTKKRK